MRYNDLRGLLHYVPLFRGKTFVILIEGEVIDSPNFDNVLMDVALLHSLGLRLVLIFGARHQLRMLAAKRGLTLSSADGIGVTDETTFELSLEAISGLSTQLLQQLTNVNVRAALTNAVQAHPAGVKNGVELAHTGSVDRVDEHFLAQLTEKGVIPIIPPIGFDRSGRSLRLNSAAVARVVAVELKAEKILFLIADKYTENEQQVRQLSVEQARTLAGSIHDGGENSRAYLLRMAAESVAEGVPRCHFVDGLQDEALLGEIFSAQGTGTMIYAKPYQNIRSARRSDIPRIISMIQGAVNDEELVARSAQDVREKLADYSVLDIDGNLFGVVSLHHYPEERLAELACLYVKRSHEGSGYGSRLVKFAEEKARTLKVESIFALSTQAYHYFEEKLGYKLTSADVLPPARRERWEKSARNSRVLIKKFS
jgi:amino-acid N-acetyltransferase